MNRHNPGRVAVITGAGTGIGAATAHRFAAGGYLNGAHIPVDGGLTASDGQANLYKIGN